MIKVSKSKANKSEEIGELVFSAMIWDRMASRSLAADDMQGYAIESKCLNDKLDKLKALGIDIPGRAYRNEDYQGR